jgi:hypothetical protein
VLQPLGTARCALRLRSVQGIQQPSLGCAVAEFWGNRWNLTVGNTARFLFYDPIFEGGCVFGGRGAAWQRGSTGITVSRREAAVACMPQPSLPCSSGCIVSQPLGKTPCWSRCCAGPGATRQLSLTSDELHSTASQHVVIAAQGCTFTHGCTTRSCISTSHPSTASSVLKTFFPLWCCGRPAREG